MPDLGYNLFSPTAAFDGMTYDTIGGPDRIMTALGGEVVFRLGHDNLLSSQARRIEPGTAAAASALAAVGSRSEVEINDFHRIHAHASAKLLRITAKKEVGG